jgi:hypothetical protein
MLPQPDAFSVVSSRIDLVPTIVTFRQVSKQMQSVDDCLKTLGAAAISAAQHPPDLLHTRTWIFSQTCSVVTTCIAIIKSLSNIVFFAISSPLPLPRCSVKPVATAAAAELVLAKIIT